MKLIISLGSPFLVISVENHWNQEIHWLIINIDCTIRFSELEINESFHRLKNVLKLCIHRERWKNREYRDYGIKYWLVLTFYFSGVIFFKNKCFSGVDYFKSLISFRGNYFSASQKEIKYGLSITESYLKGKRATFSQILMVRLGGVTSPFWSGWP